MSKDIHIKKGLDLQLVGAANQVSTDGPKQGVFALYPDDFPGVTPQMVLRAGDPVAAGDVVFVSKYDPRIRFTSPVGGKVLEVVRGEKRRILRILIEADRQGAAKKFPTGNPVELSRQQVVDALLESGVWPLIRQRPYDVIARPEISAKAIFISGYATAPLSADYEYTLRGCEKELQAGIDVLSRLTDGKIYVGVDASNPTSVFRNLKGVEVVNVSGPHPAGNVGVLINHVSPVNKGETVFTVSPIDLPIIGALFTKGLYMPVRKVAVTGSQVENPKYVNTLIGAPVADVVEGNVKQGQTRYISGNVLSGVDTGKDGYLHYYHDQFTLIPEGADDSRFLGWIAPNCDKFSMLRALTFSWLTPGKKFALNANLNGGHRNFVVTGVMEKVFPMDIYPMQLAKAVLAEDIEKMEELGIYEVAPEDFALCSFVDPSKTDMQVIIRRGLDLMVKEVGF